MTSTSTSSVPDSFAIKLDEALIRTYEKDGVVCIRNAFSTYWVERLRAAIDQELTKPSETRNAFGNEESHSRFYSDTNLWPRDPEFRAFIFDSPAAAIAAAVMNSRRVRLFKDHLLVKEPSSDIPSPWHHDLPYWCVDGTQVCSIWFPVDPVNRENGGVEFIRGSHRWNKRFSPADFQSKGKRTDDELEPMPDIEAERDRYDIVSFDTDLGDCIVFHALTIHGAPANSTSKQRRRVLSTRWAGDDAFYAPTKSTSKPFQDPGLSFGDPLDSPVFPLILDRGEAA